MRLRVQTELCVVMLRESLLLSHAVSNSAGDLSRFFAQLDKGQRSLDQSCGAQGALEGVAHLVPGTADETALFLGNEGKNLFRLLEIRM